MYFKQFPKIYYDFSQDTTSTKLQVLTDITTNVRVRKQALENITLYDEYDILDGETPEMIAEKVYGDPELHWVIMLVNERYDYISDFPMSSTEFDYYVRDKYGDRIDDIHHYEYNDIIVEGKAFLRVSTDIINQVKVHDYIIDLPNTNSRIESIDKATNTLTLRIDFGTFKQNQLMAVRGIRKNDANADVFTTVAAFNVLPNSFTLFEGYNPITNYMYEVNQNEKKRRIKLISNQLITQFIREYTSLVTP